MCAGGNENKGNWKKEEKTFVGDDDPLMFHLFGRKLDYERLKAKMWKEKV